MSFQFKIPNITTVTFNHEDQTIIVGRCSLCNGNVVRYSVIVTDGFGNSNGRAWCANCGAHEPSPEAQALPVIDMVKPK